MKAKKINNKMEINKQNIKLIQSTLRLFKALPIESKDKSSARIVLNETVERGYVFSQEVLNNYKDLNKLINLIGEEYGLTAEQLNSAFHKSWNKIKNASDEQLFIEQIVHYITTYGFESLGIYDENSIYIPQEKLDIPELEEDIKLIIIKGYTKEELKEKVIKLLSTGIALKEQTMEDLITIINYVGFGTDEIEQIKNKEVKIQLYDRLGVIPEDPLEFLRYLVFKTTGETLLIKNDNLIEKIKERGSDNQLIEQYAEEYGLEKLATIFYRFKCIFLAFKPCNKVGPFLNGPHINKIRRLAKIYHKPMKEDFLNMITSIIKNGKQINDDYLIEELKRVNTFRKIRLAYALRYRTTDATSIMYRVRNGKSYSKEIIEYTEEQKFEAQRVLYIVLKSIIKDVSKNVKCKKIFYPEIINYTLPATEKQFIGNFPNGSYVKTTDDMIVGINWFNVGNFMVDLDLKMTSDGEMIGWDGNYKTKERGVMFSGDITSAGGKNGATELFKFSKQPTEPYLMTVNYYNYNSDVPVDFKILVAKEKPTKFKENYMVNPNNVLASCKSKIDKREMVLGLILPTEDGSRFYFTETGLGNKISARGEDYITWAREYMVNQYNNSIELRDILEQAGAIFVDKVEDAEIDLSYENLEKDTILEMLK